jgi:hypothetical protein
MALTRNECDPPRERCGDRPDDILLFVIAVHPERQEQQARLVDVQIGAVDHGDRPFLQIEAM